MLGVIILNNKLRERNYKYVIINSATVLVNLRKICSTRNPVEIPNGFPLDDVWRRRKFPVAWE